MKFWFPSRYRAWAVCVPRRRKFRSVHRQRSTSAVAAVGRAVCRFHVSGELFGAQDELAGTSEDLMCGYAGGDMALWSRGVL